MSSRISEVEKLKAQVNRIYEGLASIVSVLNELEEAWEQGQGIWGASNIKWTQAEGAKGPYERADQQPGNRDYDLMLKDLQDHKGQLTRDGWFYWQFSDGKAVGRERKLRNFSYNV